MWGIWDLSGLPVQLLRKSKIILKKKNPFIEEKESRRLGENLRGIYVIKTCNQAIKNSQNSTARKQPNLEMGNGSEKTLHQRRSTDVKLHMKRQ